MRWLTVGLVSIVLAFGFVALVKGEIIVSDGGFSSGWHFGQWTSGGGSASVVREGIGGNPGVCLNIAAVNPSKYHVSARGIARYDVFTWNPATDGEILSVGMSIDAKDDIGRDHELYLLVYQDGKYYGTPRVRPDALTGECPNWTTLIRGPYTASSFAYWAGPRDAQWDLTQRPDFSPSGSPLRFGFSAGNEGHTGTRIKFYDNWSVSLGVVPEPPTLVLLSTAAVVLVTLVRRRRNRAT